LSSCRRDTLCYSLETFTNEVNLGYFYCSRNKHRLKGNRRMRFKLILIVSMVVSIVGSVGTAFLLYLSFGSIEFARTRGFWLISSCVVPAILVLTGGFFVYRHTAKRRVLQAMLTIVISVFIILSIFLASVLILRKPSPRVSVAWLASHQLENSEILRPRHMTN